MNECQQPALIGALVGVLSYQAPHLLFCWSHAYIPNLSSPSSSIARVIGGSVAWCRGQLWGSWPGFESQLYDFHWSGGHGNPPQYSCLENSIDNGAWHATVHAVAKSRTRLSD